MRGGGAAELTGLEQLVMLAVHRHRGEAYGVVIQEDIKERTGRDHSFGAIYNVLSKLEQKGFVTSREGDPTPERGGRAKRYYALTGQGAHSLAASLAALERMKAGLVLSGDEVTR